MSDLVEKAEDLAAKPGRLSRRTFVGRVAKVSAGLVAAAAGIASLRGSGFPAVAGLAYVQSCCNLAYPWRSCSGGHCDKVHCTYKEWTCRDQNNQVWTCSDCVGCNCSDEHQNPINA
jgi:hypothetical protein